MANIGLQRLASQVRLVVSDGLRKKLSDPRLERMASITHVEITPDLSFADVSISVMGTESQQRAFMRGLDHAHGVLQRMVGKNLQTRTCPTLRFHLDQSIKKGFETMQLIEKSMAERAQREGTRETSSPEDRADSDLDRHEEHE
jgi:ribosome-binding factor A